jgi:predicted MPP superfamily phosphohydrolase
MRTLEVLLKLTRQYERGVRNAWDVAVRGVDVPLENLPVAFDGFTVLHLSDLHLDGMPGLEEAILERVGAREFDLCVLTGDYRTELHGPIRPTMDRLQPLVSRLRSRHGVLGVLGNHDDCHMVGPMEAMGIRMLVNESVRLTRGEDVLQVVGTDDVHYYFTDQAVHALESARDAFTLALVHSPEAFDFAADLGVDLYLCGHTHAGRCACRAAGPSSRTSRGAGASTVAPGGTAEWWASPTPARARPGSPSGSTPAARSWS